MIAFTLAALALGGVGFVALLWLIVRLGEWLGWYVWLLFERDETVRREVRALVEREKARTGGAR